MANFTNAKEYRFEKVCEHPTCNTIFQTNDPNKRFCTTECRKDSTHLAYNTTAPSTSKEIEEQRLAMFNNQFLMQPLRQRVE